MPRLAELGSAEGRLYQLGSAIDRYGSFFTDENRSFAVAPT